MFVLSGTIGHNLRPNTVFLIILLSIIASAPPALFGQSIETGRNSIKLIWTASGDDNDLGRASFYDIRYSTNPVGADTALWWHSARQSENVPTPSISGMKDSCVIENLSPGLHYYFAVKMADEAYNWSGIAEIAELPKVFCADINGDLSCDYIDLIYLLSYLFDNGPTPITQASGDVDNSGEINVADAMYLINYRLNSGPPPDCGD